MCCHIEFAKTKCRPTECVFPTHLTERLQATTTSRVGRTGTGRGGGVKGEQAHALDFNGFERQKQISVCAIGVCVCVRMSMPVCVSCVALKGTKNKAQEQLKCKRECNLEVANTKFKSQQSSE